MTQGQVSVESPGSKPSDRLEEAAALVRASIVWDNVFPLQARFDNGWDRLDQLADAGWTAISVIVAGDWENAAEALNATAAARREIRERADRMVPLLTASDVDRAKQQGKLAVGLQLQGTRCFERNLDLVEAFFRLGVRHALIAFNNANAAGGGCAEPDSGLTVYGRRLVAEMERVGMLVDLSHTGWTTSRDVLDMATRPVIFSHSNAHAVYAHWRNVKDDLILACAATGGLIGLSGSSGYLGGHSTSTDRMFAHLDHMTSLVGADHVGLGLDLLFESSGLNAFLRTRPDEWPEAAQPDWPGYTFAKPAQLVELVGMMLAHGYARDDVGKILGGNYMRLAEAVWGQG